MKVRIFSSRSLPYSSTYVRCRVGCRVYQRKRFGDDVLDFAVHPGDQRGAGKQRGARIGRQVRLLDLLQVGAALGELHDDLRAGLAVVGLPIGDVNALQMGRHAGFKTDRHRMPFGPDAQRAEHPLRLIPRRAGRVEVHGRLEHQFLKRHRRIAVAQRQRPVRPGPDQCGVGERDRPRRVDPAAAQRFDEVATQSEPVGRVERVVGGDDGLHDVAEGDVDGWQVVECANHHAQESVCGPDGFGRRLGPPGRDATARWRVRLRRWSPVGAGRRPRLDTDRGRRRTLHRRNMRRVHEVRWPEW